MFTKSLFAAIDSIWPMLTIFIVVLISVRIAYLKINNKGFVFYKEIFSLIFVVYLILLFELVTRNDGGNGGTNLIPFVEIFRHSFGSKEFIYNVIGNIIVFIPFGYFISAYINAKKGGSIFLITLITSLTIELVQIGVGRAFDIDDIILNVGGGILGFLLFIGLAAIKKHLPEIFKKNFIYNIISLILLILAIGYFLKLKGYGW